jgi:hypothetical protein
VPYSSGRAEELVPLVQERLFQSICLVARDNHQLVPVEFLLPIPQHLSVDLREDVPSYFDYEVWTNADDIAVECRMVELA